MDLFATGLNHKVPLYVCPVPNQHDWDIDALNIVWSGLSTYADQKLGKPICLIIVKAPDWPGMPWFWDLLQLSTEIPLQLPVSTTVLQPSVSQQSTVSQPSRLVSRSGQLQEQCFSVEVTERIAAPQRSSTRTIYQSSGPCLIDGAEIIQWISPLPL